MGRGEGGRGPPWYSLRRASRKRGRAGSWNHHRPGFCSVHVGGGGAGGCTWAPPTGQCGEVLDWALAAPGVSTSGEQRVSHTMASAVLLQTRTFLAFARKSRLSPCLPLCPLVVKREPLAATEGAKRMVRGGCGRRQGRDFPAEKAVSWQRACAAPRGSPVAQRKRTRHMSRRTGYVCRRRGGEWVR